MAEPKEQRHAWLDLLDVDGPFLSRPALDDVFDGAWPPKISNDHRDLLAPPDVRPTDWDEALPIVERLLTEVLGYQPGRTLSLQPGSPVRHPIHDKATVTPYAVAHVSRRQDEPRMIVLAGRDASPTPDALDPQATSDHMGWPSTPVQRAALAARSAGADIALVTNGHDHLIVWVGSGVTGYAWVDPSLYRLDRRLVDGFVALMAAPTVTTVADTATSDLLKLSQDKQVDVTEKLGLQVRRAAEALVNAVSRANRNTDGKLLVGVDPEAVYAGVVTVLMRTVFLLNAEERNLISSGDLWDRAYSVSTLLEQLDGDHYLHQGVMRRRHGAWLRLLAAARAVHGGVHHSQMNVPAYGGNLFDPTRHPFLEGTGVDGEVFDVGVVDDATLRHVLDLLQRLDGQRISYRAFSVEQIGQVYESLLDHSAVSVPEGDVVLGLVGTRGNEPEVSLDDLEMQRAKGKLADWLAKEHDPSSGQGKKAKWEARIAKAPDDRVAATLGQACSGDAEILERVEQFAGLLRVDARGVALVFLSGDVYVTETSSKGESGTAYTSPSLAAEVAQHSLEHLVYEPGPRAVVHKSHWRIKSPSQLLDLHVCDPAVGSGAILVAAVRYLADKLVESRLEYGELSARDLETAAADPGTTDPHVQARRDVVAHCVYAVDRDPMAVEMAKLSLWLVTMAHGQPFTFLDHAIKCGDSLLGVTSLDELRRVRLISEPIPIGIRPVELSDGASLQAPMLAAEGKGSGQQFAMFAAEASGGYTAQTDDYFQTIQELLTEARTLRKRIRAAAPTDVREAEWHEELHRDAQDSIKKIRFAADAIVAACLSTAHRPDRVTDERLAELPALLGDLQGGSNLADLQERIERWKEEGNPRPKLPRRLFHWPIEFPEVFIGGQGFDAMVGNPPFLGAQKIIGPFGEDYRQHLTKYVSFGSTGIRGKSDLVGYFFRRAATLANSFGLIATSSIWQGDTRETALDPLCVPGGGTVFRAESLAPWPGAAGVHVAKVWWKRGHWDGQHLLDGVPVRGIESDLYPSGDVAGRPLRLPRQMGIASPGPKFYGGGLRLGPEQASQMVKVDPKNAEVLAPYCNGAWINASPSERKETAEWVIDFRGWPLDRARLYEEPIKFIEASLARDNGAEAKGRDKWWVFQNRRPTLLQAMEGLDHVLVFAEVSSRVIPLRVPAAAVYGNTAVVVATEDWTTYGVLSSTVHRVWADRYGSALGTGIRYTPRTIFDTLPLPEASDELAQAIHELHDWRNTVFLDHDEGVSSLYGAYHNPRREEALVADLRRRHEELDILVLSAYGWEDLARSATHGHHETRFGTYYSFDDSMRYEVLSRLLQLNFEQAAEQTGRSLDSIMREAQQHV